MKRVYARPDPDDGLRIFVDRLWPRGVSKTDTRIDLRLKGIAPGTELRRWFGHDPAKWRTFTARYVRELKENRSGIIVSCRENFHAGKYALKSPLSLMDLRGLVI